MAYCDAPVETRFKPGQSGNPSGRRKGSKNITTIIEEMLFTEIKDGAGNTLVPAQGMVKAQVKKALSGDTRAFAELIDRVDGKAIQRNREVDKDGNDINQMNEGQLAEFIRRAAATPAIAAILGGNKAVSGVTEPEQASEILPVQEAT